jgi:hypothetical protein
MTQSPREYHVGRGHAPANPDTTHPILRSQEPPWSSALAGAGEMAALRAEVAQLRQELDDVQERLDFTERA